MNVLRDPIRFSSREILSIAELLPPEVLDLISGVIPMEGTLIGVDQPDHTQLRRVLEPTLSPSAVAAMEPMVRSLCNEILDTKASSGPGDLLAQVAYPLPLTVISRFIGIHDEDTDICRAAAVDWLTLAMALLTGVALDEQLTIAARVIDGYQLVERLLEDKYQRRQKTY